MEFLAVYWEFELRQTRHTVQESSSTQLRHCITAFDTERAKGTFDLFSNLALASNETGRGDES